MTDTQYRTEAPINGDDRIVQLPFYLLCDVSYSMEPHLDTLNEALRNFRDSLAKDPILADKVQFGVVDFADDARSVVPLGDFTAANLDAHRLTCRGGTSYGSAFTTIRDTIATDIAAGASQYRYFRPAVFFLTDGCPTDTGWENAFHALTDYDPTTDQGFRSYPLFVPFGIGSADATILAQLVYPKDRSALFMANSGVSPTSAIEAMTSAMLKSVLASSRSVIKGGPQHVVPTQADVGPNVTAYPGGDFVN